MTNKTLDLVLEYLNLEDSKVGEELYNRENDDDEREYYKGAEKDNKRRHEEELKRIE